MATKKKPAAKKTKGAKKHSAATISKFNPAFHKILVESLAAPDVTTGSCQWTDPQGGFHCANNVTKDACDNLSGKFFPNSSC